VDDSSLMHVLRGNVEHMEMDYLKAIGAGPGWPFFVIADLTDPGGLDFARRAGRGAEAESILADAAADGVEPCLVCRQVLVRHYSEFDGWFKDCPAGRYPVLVISDGGSMAFARPEPEGIDGALRLRLLNEFSPELRRMHGETAAAGISPAVAVAMDLKDPVGVRAASACFGPGAVAAELAAYPDRARPVMLSLGAPSSANYPGDWGGPLPPGKFAVQVVAEGRVLNALLDESGNVQPCEA